MVRGQNKKSRYSFLSKSITALLHFDIHTFFLMSGTDIHIIPHDTQGGIIALALKDSAAHLIFLFLHPVLSQRLRGFSNEMKDIAVRSPDSIILNSPILLNQPYEAHKGITDDRAQRIGYDIIHIALSQLEEHLAAFDHCAGNEATHHGKRPFPQIFGIGGWDQISKGYKHCHIQEEMPGSLQVPLNKGLLEVVKGCSQNGAVHAADAHKNGHIGDDAEIHAKEQQHFPVGAPVMVDVDFQKEENQSQYAQGQCGVNHHWVIAGVNFKQADDSGHQAIHDNDYNVDQHQIAPGIDPLHRVM